MADKALISELTWRTLEMQKAAFPDMRHYLLPNDESALLRPTQRKQKDVLHAMSLAVIAETENDFRCFVRMARKIGASIVTKDGCVFPHTTVADAIEVWKIARRSGAGKIGAEISANNKRAKSAERIELIDEDWPKPSTEFSTRELLKRSGLSLNTVKSHLGSRPIAQYNYQAKLKRAANRVKK